MAGKATWVFNCLTVTFLDPPEDQPGRRVRREPRIADRVGALNVVRDGIGDNEEVVDFAIARGSLRGVDRAADLLQPPRGFKFSRAAIPISAEHPRPDQPGEGEGNGIEEVEV